MSFSLYSDWVWLQRHGEMVSWRKASGWRLSVISWDNQGETTVLNHGLGLVVCSIWGLRWACYCYCDWWLLRRKVMCGGVLFLLWMTVVVVVIAVVAVVVVVVVVGVSWDVSNEWMIHSSARTWRGCEVVWFLKTSRWWLWILLNRRQWWIEYSVYWCSNEQGALVMRF